jgi:DNA-binding transcriptional ArsR family regulator
MTAILADIPADALEHCSEILKSIAHPIRMSMIDLLGQRGALTVTDIHQALGIEQAVASHHLGILKQKDLLSATRDGRNTIYKLEQPGLLQVLECVRKCNVQN